MGKAHSKATTHMNAEETMKQNRAEERRPLAKPQPCQDMLRGDTIHPRFQKDEQIAMYRMQLQDLVGKRPNLWKRQKLLVSTSLHQRKTF